MPNFKILGEREYNTTTAAEENNFYTSSVASCLVIYGENENHEAKCLHLLTANYVSGGVIVNSPNPLDYLEAYPHNRQVYGNKTYEDRDANKKLLAHFQQNGYTVITEESVECVFYQGKYNPRKLNVPNNIPAYNSTRIEDGALMRQSPNEDRVLDFQQEQ